MADRSNHKPDRRTFLQATGVAASAAAFTAITQATPGREPGPKTGEWVVLTGATTSMSTAEAEVQATVPDEANVTHRNETLGYLTVEDPSPGAASMDSPIVEDLRELSFVETVERNVTYHAFAAPNDSLYDQQYAPQQVRAPQAYDTTDGSSDVTVAIVDQGVYYDHPDLQGRFGANKGYDHVDGDGDPAPESMSEEYHGTHVAGIASATTDNSTGIAGISDSTLLSGRALGTGGGGSLTDIADAIQWAADEGADIINLSLGGGGYRETMKNAVSHAVNNGALPICAAGNNGESSVSYPAAYSECVAVSAVDSNEDLADFSQYGDKCDVAAPGVDVLSTWTEDQSQFGGKYNKISGTSMACPAASGVAALGLAADPDLSPTQLRARLKNTAVDIGLDDDEQGAGRVDALNIVEAGDDDDDDDDDDDNTAPTVSINASSTTVDVGTAVEFDGSGSSDPDGSVASYDWDFDNGETATGASATVTFENAGTYDVQLTVTDDDGASSTDAVAVTAESGGGGGSCGDVTETESVSGSLSGYWDSASITYETLTSDPCQVSFVLDGPYSADFDLYVTYDGRTPTTYDYDARAATYGADETLVVDDVDAGQTFGILVDSYDGSGSFTLSAEEVGK
ncbi:S8 family serine peptidase [Halorubellus sp. JP-L1]|uniref:S8 family serine peptidase n=1 Tax=Halorubellus sp. JP-L1 TaxID=2715753 RepID=UPI0014077E98|nr:S8 family serine peptidase [Halorubellus sp. JP-L1]NHN41409.1 S8 family serine peptidase [Halorubellus sp. JP-L1]